MTVYRTAQGKMIDMTQLASKNEKIRAVGNMNVNARGDVIDGNNHVITDNNKRVKQTYKNTVNTAASASTRPTQRKVIEPIPDLPELSESEKELFDDNDEDIKK